MLTISFRPLPPMTEEERLTSLWDVPSEEDRAGVQDFFALERAVAAGLARSFQIASTATRLEGRLEDTYIKCVEERLAA